MPRQPTPDILDPANGSRANTDSLAGMFGPVAGDERIQQIPLHALDDNPYQRRSAGYGDDDASLIELSTDIAANGIHQPLVVRQHPDQDREHGRYQIAAGHRRRKAASMAGLESVPCIVRDLTDDQMLDVVFGENYHRTDINPIDRAELMAMLVEQGLTQQQIADRFSVSRPTVANALRLLARTYGKWEQRNDVVNWDAEQCIPVIVAGLIKQYTPYEPEKNLANCHAEYAKLLAIAGLRAPWLPPLEEEIARRLDDARTWLDDYLDPGDGTPTQDAIHTFVEDLRSLGDTIMERIHNDQRSRLMERYTRYWLEAIALQDRVDASYILHMEKTS
jgi:ParB/RepB/Spo0J family partition protein